MPRAAEAHAASLSFRQLVYSVESTTLGTWAKRRLKRREDDLHFPSRFALFWCLRPRNCCVSTRCPARRCCARLTDRSALWFRSAASWARVAARAAGGLARPRVAGGWRAYLQPRHPRHLPGLPPSLSTGQALSFPLHLSCPLSGLLGHPLPSLRAVVPAHVPRLQKVSPSRVCEKERDEEVDRGSPLAAAVLLAPFLSSWSACCSSPALQGTPFGS